MTTDGTACEPAARRPAAPDAAPFVPVRVADYGGSP